MKNQAITAAVKKYERNTKTMRVIRYISSSIKGSERNTNKDRCFSCFENIGVASFFSVFDGVSSTRYSHVCIIEATKNIRASMSKVNNGTTLSCHDILLSANISVLNKNIKDGYATIAALLIPNTESRTITASHLGDSRIYKIHKQYIEKITNDHAIQNTNIVTQYLGKENASPSDVEIFHQDGTQYLICSDGFTNFIHTNTSEIHNALLDSNIANTKNKIDNIVRKRNSDDASYMLIRIDNV